MANWEGYEDLRTAAKKAPTFGNADPEVDALASWVSDQFTARVNSFTSPRGSCAAGAYSAGVHVAMGYGVWATPNGRRKGEPLSDGPNRLHHLLFGFCQFFCFHIL